LPNKADVVVTIITNILNFTISELVTKVYIPEGGEDTFNPVISPSITIAVGDQIFNSARSELGTHSTEISIDDSYQNTFVKAGARPRHIA